MIHIHAYSYYSNDIRFDRNKFKVEDNSGSFLLESVANGVNIFNISDDLDCNIQIYEYFNSISFIVVSYQSDAYIDNIYFPAKKLKELGVSFPSKSLNRYKFFYITHSESIDNIDIIEKVRGSKTFVPSESNSLINESEILINFIEAGFVQKDKISLENAPDKFNRTLLIYLLGVAYNLQTELFIKESIICYKGKAFDSLVSMRSDIHLFEVQYYFSIPVKNSSYQTIRIWKLISDVLNIKDFHSEMKDQLIELTDIINEKRLEDIKIAKENELSLIREANDKRDKKNDKNNLILQVGLIVIGFFQALPVIIQFFK
jgi:hypothetical protein